MNFNFAFFTFYSIKDSHEVLHYNIYLYKLLNLFVFDKYIFLIRLIKKLIAYE